MQETESLSFVLGRVSVFSRPSPDEKGANEDRAAIVAVDDERMVLIVADGAGGYGNGDIASQIAVDAIITSIESINVPGKELREAILSGIDNANRQILNSTGGAATTIAIVEISNRTLRVYHVGDTEVLVTGQRGKVKLQTLSHSPVSYAVEAGLLDEEQAILHQERHIVSNILGFPEMHISISGPIKLAQRDTVIVASDGVFDNLQKGEVVEYIRKGPLESCSKLIIEGATNRMLSDETDQPSKADDLTFILYRRHTFDNEGKGSS